MTTRRSIAAGSVALGLLAPATASAAYTVGPINAVEQVPLPADTTIATFDTGSNLAGCATADQFAAQVAWGDLTPIADAVVVGPVDPAFLAPCRYLVQAGHLYANAGTSTMGVQVTGPGAPGVGTGPVTVADAQLTAVPPAQLALTEASKFTGRIGGFSNANLSEKATEFSVSISWGDGTPPSNGTVRAAAAPGTFDLLGDHLYTRGGSYDVQAIVRDADGGVLLVGAKAVVADRPLVVVSTSPPVSGFTSKDVNPVLAVFRDSNSGGTLADQGALVDWGDGTRSVATITPTSARATFAVRARHRYRTPGRRTITTLITNSGGGTLAVNTPASIALPSRLRFSLGGVAFGTKTVTAKLRCVEAATSCRGRLVLRRAATARVLGTSVFVIPPRGSAILRLRLGPAVARELQRVRTFRATLTATAYAPGGDKVSTTVRVARGTIRRAAR